MTLSYSIVTAARDEADTLPRLADALRAQALPVMQWVIVENGSSDRTEDVARALASKHGWVTLGSVTAHPTRERGAPIVQAINAGLAMLDPRPDVLVNVDADVTMGPDYFKRLVRAFEDQASLGIASGSAWENDGDGWAQRFVTGGTVWGATRAYRWKCLQDVQPLEQRHGWDGIDQLRARARGWETRTFTDLPFYHHRQEGQLDGSTWSHWVANGDTCHFMGYRPWYLIARTMYHARRDLAAIGLLHGYARGVVRRAPRLADPEALAVLRDDQRFRNILHRRREALGEAGTSDGHARVSA